ncbi:MAG: acetate--CoA ligase family protein, partial [Chloroflexi bacterium]|nr:acetate--CoA ligase family protein [Chloroflexota bacterium]
CYASVSVTPSVPDLAVVIIPATGVAAAVEECGQVGCKSVIVISAGFKEAGEAGIQREQELAAVAEKYNIRIIGPNCMGTVGPKHRLNATFFKKGIPKAGGIAFFSQSGAFGSAILDWAITRHIGLSGFVSIGSMMDVDFGDLIYYFADDPETTAICVYMETIPNAKKFIASARYAAKQGKPIVAVMPGRSAESAAAAASHTGSMVGNDMFNNAVFERAGIVRLINPSDLFHVAELLNLGKQPKDQRLAIVTNAGGPGVLATDALMDEKGKLAKITPEFIAKINDDMPATWSRSNPIDIIGDAGVARYAIAVDAAINDENIDAVTVIYTPQGDAESEDIADAVIKLAETTDKPVMTVWMGEGTTERSRCMFIEKKIPAYRFPEHAVQAFANMTRFQKLNDKLNSIAAPVQDSRPADNSHLKAIIKAAKSEGRTILNETESKTILEAYGIAATRPYFAASAEEAAQIADKQLKYPVVMKIASKDISHKSDVGGVILNLKNANEVREAFRNMMVTVSQNMPAAQLDGVTLQRMVSKYDYELIIGSTTDPAFGPVILFGAGGTQAEFYKDVAVGLPPLNRNLARNVMTDTKIYQMLSKGFRDKPVANLALIEETLVKFSNLLEDFPSIAEIDINPLAMTADEAIALDGRIVLKNQECCYGCGSKSSNFIASL